MDERFKGKKTWIGLGALGIIFLCVMLCGFGAMVTLFMRSAPVHGTVPQVQSPPGEEGAAPPPTYNYGPGSMGMGRHAGWGPLGFLGFGIGLIFRLLFFGLILLLLLGLVKRLFFGHRHWAWAHHGKPPRGEEWKGRPHPRWGPWAWHFHGAPWETEAEGPGEEDEPDEAESEYAGPQE
jgi:hypothetical protein